MRLEFKNGELSKILKFKTEPVIRTSKVTVSLLKSDWVSKLLRTNLTIKIIGLNAEQQTVISSQEYLFLNITPYHRQPVFEEKRYFKLSDSNPRNNITRWIVELTVNNLDLEEGESLSLFYIDQDYILRRATDWGKRVHGLIAQISTWSETLQNIQVRPSRKLPMHEGLMKDFKVPMQELETADVLKNGKLIIAVKPFGLWIIGANGRVDMLSAKGNYILIDEAEHFKPPQWKIFLNNDRQKGIPFDIEAFKQITN